MVPMMLWAQQQEDEGNTPGPLDFVFSHFTGIYLYSTVVFIIYCIVNRPPKIYPAAILPGMVSGMNLKIRKRRKKKKERVGVGSFIYFFVLFLFFFFYYFNSLCRSHVGYCPVWIDVSHTDPRLYRGLPNWLSWPHHCLIMLECVLFP